MTEEYKSKRKTFKERIEEVSLKFKDKLDFSKSVRLNEKGDIIFICKDHGEQPKAGIYNILRSKYGCKDCKKEANFKIESDKFIEHAKKFHNNKYDYSLVKYTGNNEYVKIICPVHGEFPQTPKSHKEYGCNKCGFNTMIESKKTPLKSFIEKASKIHNNKYTYDNVVYVNNKTYIWITCPIHGDFKQTPANHTSKSNPNGCPPCGTKSQSEKVSKK